MFLRALVAFLCLPGIVAFAVPVTWLVIGSRFQLLHPFGLAPLCLGIIALLWCVRDFYIQGKGTLAPWAPPTQLVIVGLYRWSRNPMYIAVTLILLGWAWAFAHAGLFVYAIVVAVAFHIRVVFGEEPWLAKTYGDEWEAYARRVGRWF